MKKTVQQAIDTPDKNTVLQFWVSNDDDEQSFETTRAVDPMDISYDERGNEWILYLFDSKYNECSMPASAETRETTTLSISAELANAIADAVIRRRRALGVS